MDAGIVTLISVAINALTAVFAPLFAKKLSRQREQIRKTEETCELIGTGLEIVENAIDENKEALAGSGAGDAVTYTIRNYGPAAKQLVDSARLAARRFNTAAAEAYEQEIISQERRERLERERRALND